MHPIPQSPTRPFSTAQSNSPDSPEVWPKPNIVSAVPSIVPSPETVPVSLVSPSRPSSPPLSPRQSTVPRFAATVSPAKAFPTPVDTMDRFSNWRILTFAAGLTLAGLGVGLCLIGGISVFGIFLAPQLGIFMFATGLAMVTESGVLPPRPR